MAGVNFDLLQLYYDLNVNIIQINVVYLIQQLIHQLFYLKAIQIKLVYTLMSNFVSTKRDQLSTVRIIQDSEDIM